MSKNMSDKYLRTKGFILRRTNYAEADRILNILTPVGKISAIARGVRWEKSKLAGGVEMFSLVDLNICEGKGELRIITSAKMIKFYGGILKDFNRVELASGVLKKINKISDSSETEEYFKILSQVFFALDLGVELRLIEAWFILNLNKAVGEEINLYRDNLGRRLEADRKYEWDNLENAFFERDDGRFGADEIKILRLMMTNDLQIVRRIKINESLMQRIFEAARSMDRI